MIPGRVYTPDEVLKSVLWARKWQVVFPFVLVATATIVITARLPNRYRSEALIQATSQSVSQEFVRNTVATSETMKERLPSISQQILSRTRIERIIRDLGLDERSDAGVPMETLVTRLRDHVEVETTDGADAFRLSFEADTPLLAMQVTERLAALFIEENSRDREQLAHATSTFLESQLQDARGRLVEQEKRLEAYRLRFGAELPTQLESNLQVIQNTQAQIQALNEAINRDRDRRLLVARQLADLESEQFLADPALPGAGSATLGASTLAQLEAARAELAALERRVTPEHPDIVRAIRLVAELESQFEREAADSPDAAAKKRPLTAAELAKRNRVKELQAEIESLDRQVATRAAEVAQIRLLLQAYQARVEAVPTRESELASLTRDYDTLQTLYRTLLTKKEDSRIAENLERKQVGEQFKILDAPDTPVRPHWPNRLLFDAVGAAGGLLFGVGLAGLLEFRDKRFKGEADVRAALGLPVVGSIPIMTDATDRRTARWQAAARSLAAAAVLGTCVVAVLWTFYR